MLKHYTLFSLLLISINCFSQNNKYTNYQEFDKEIFVLDFGYIVDSTETISIPREQAAKVYAYVESEILKFHKELKRDFDAPFRLTFKSENESGKGQWKTTWQSKFTSTALWVLTKHWPHKISELEGSALDYSKELFIEIGPSIDYYKILLKQPSDVDYAMEIGFSSQKNPKKLDHTFESSINAVTPVFPGGVLELNRFIFENIVKPLPKEDRKHAIGDFVYWLTIEKDGSISNIKVGSNASTHQRDMKFNVLDEIRKMPNWTPANYYGDPVKSIYELRVLFKPYFYENLLQITFE